MYEKYPISGIKQTYRRQNEVRTVAMPLLIGILLLGLALFFFKSKPTAPEGEEPIVSNVEENTVPAPEDAPEKDLGTDETEEKSDSQIQALPVESVPVSSIHSKGESSLVALSQPKAPAFTEWMSPSDLDFFIRSQNEGHEQSFWQRGHWITAVEGRWESENHEFRISYEKMPSPDSWEWQYRVDQSKDEFVENIQSYSSNGFTLVQSNSYQRPDGSQRFQAVWKRDTSSQTIADTGVSNETTPLDIQ